jgi:hypothetical protein
MPSQGLPRLRRRAGTAPSCRRVVACLVAGIAGMTAAAQEPTFRTTTRLVIQTVTVTDRAGAPLDGLTAADFIVIEDGERQEIAFLEYQHLRAQPGAPPPAVAAVRMPADPGGPAVPPVVGTGLPSTIGSDARFRDRRLLIFASIDRHSAVTPTASGPSRARRATRRPRWRRPTSWRS